VLRAVTAWAEQPQTATAPPTAIERAPGPAARSSATADLVVTMTGGDVNRDGDIGFDIRVANAGPERATGVTLAFTMPADATVVVPATPGRGVCSRPPAMTCDLGVLDNGDSAFVRIVMRPRADGQVTVSATATAAEADPNTKNNTAVAKLGRLSPPSDLIAGRSGHQVVLRWKDDSRGESRFQIERSTNGGPFRVISSADHRVTTFRDRLSGTERAYTYRVRAVSSTAASAYSNELTFTLAGRGGLHVSRSALKFHGVRAGSAETRMIVVKNIGPGPLSGTVTAPGGAFSVASGGGAYTLAAGASKNVTVRFAPTAPGHTVGSLVITSDDPKRASTKVTLTGQAR
jgi:hypothetical protein